MATKEPQRNTTCTRGLIGTTFSIDLRAALLLFNLIITILTYSDQSQAAEQPESLPLSPITVTSGCEYDYPPYCIVTADKQADGFSVELLRAALKVMGREVSFKVGPWSEVKEDLANKRIQCLPLVGRTPEREGVFDFTFPYLTMHGTIVLRDEETGILSLDDLKGKQVAVMQGDNAEEFVRRSDLNMNVIATRNFED